jgi:hypothetical protein
MHVWVRGSFNSKETKLVLNTRALSPAVGDVEVDVGALPSAREAILGEGWRSIHHRAGRTQRRRATHRQPLPGRSERRPVLHCGAGGQSDQAGTLGLRAVQRSRLHQLDDLRNVSQSIAKCFLEHDWGQGMVKARKGGAKQTVCISRSSPLQCVCIRTSGKTVKER